jgi:hypothetical protein
MDREYNQILLVTKDGRQVSIVQGGISMGKKGKTCEVWIVGQDEPVGHFTARQLTKYLVENVL